MTEATYQCRLCLKEKELAHFATSDPLHPYRTICADCRTKPREEEAASGEISDGAGLDPKTINEYREKIAATQEGKKEAAKKKQVHTEKELEKPGQAEKKIKADRKKETARESLKKTRIHFNSFAAETSRSLVEQSATLINPQEINANTAEGENRNASSTKDAHNKKTFTTRRQSLFSGAVATRPAAAIITQNKEAVIIPLARTGQLFSTTQPKTMEPPSSAATNAFKK